MKNEIQTIAYRKILAIIFVCLISTSVFAQDITNTLAPGGKFIVKDASTTFFSIRQADGYIGIGTETPGVKLQVSGGPICGQGLLLQMGDFPGDASKAEFLTYKYSSTNWGGIGGDWDGGIWFRGSDYYFWGQGASLNPTMMMSSTGNVGIGTSTPGAKLDLRGSDALINGFTLGRGNGNDSTNTVFGFNALYSNTDGNSNTAVGWYSLRANLDGANNTSVGYGSLYYNTTGGKNTAVGGGSLHNNNGNFNTAVGNDALHNNSTGNYNTAVGLQSLYHNVIGVQNTAVGYDALFTNFGGNNNTAVGWESLPLNTSGVQNTAVGVYSLRWNNIGHQNTALGYNAGYYITTGYNLTCLGFDAYPTSEDATNQITLGNGEITSLRCNVTTITSLSDARDKKKIKDLDLGIDFLMKIKPRQFNWDRREWYEDNISDGSKMKKEPTAGFIAQELDEAQTEANADWLDLVLKDNPEKWEATPGNLLPIMVKAIQELKAENEQLKNQLADVGEIKEQIAEIKTLKAELQEQIKILKASNNNEEIKFTSIITEEVEK
jgi:trimeric autotransporter adhesin